MRYTGLTIIYILQWSLLYNDHHFTTISTYTLYSPGWEVVFTGTGTECECSHLSPGTCYPSRVRASSEAGGKGLWSPMGRLYTEPVVPQAPATPMMKTEPKVWLKIVSISKSFYIFYIKSCFYIEEIVSMWTISFKSFLYILYQKVWICILRMVINVSRYLPLYSQMNELLHLVKSNQILNVITLAWLIWPQIKLRLVANLSENYNNNCNNGHLFSIVKFTQNVCKMQHISEVSSQYL